MPGTQEADPRRWTALVFIALAQLMVVLDATIVNIALPSAQHALHITDANRQWVITAYTLAFGGLLLFGGRISDLAGRRRAFLIGLIGFAAASALGGAAVNSGMLLGARALQGAFGALLAPAALSLLTVSFTEGRERAKAFGIFGAIAGGGGALGLILGGLLTEYLDWRWALYVNVPIAVIAALGALFVIREPAGTRNTSGLDIPGVLLATIGLVALVYGFTRAESDGWTAPVTVAMYAVAVVLLAAFVLVEKRVRAPLLPLRVITDRVRGGVYLSLGLAVIAMFGVFLFLTYYLQAIKGYSPIVSGVAFLPMIAGMLTGSTQIGARLITRIPGRRIMTGGFLTAAVGMVLLAQLQPGTPYPALMLPGLLLMGLGMGSAFMPAMSLATYGVTPQDAGVASAMVNTSQQVGGSIGTALLNTIAASSTSAWIAAHGGAGALTKAQQATGLVHGYNIASWCAVGALAVAALIAFTVVRPGGGNATEEMVGLESTDGEELQVPVVTH